MPGREKLYICGDVRFPNDPRVLACEDPDGCLGLWYTLVAYARRYLTDGRVPRRYALRDARNDNRLLDMVRTGLLTEDGDSVVVIGYSDLNPLRDAVEAARVRARDRAIAPALRAAVIARDGQVCRLCWLHVEVDDIHIDHVVPFSKGGRTVLENLQVAHSSCNLRKGDR